MYLMIEWIFFLLLDIVRSDIRTSPHYTIAKVLATSTSKTNTATTYLAYIVLGVFALLLIFYCFSRKHLDEELNQPLLGGMYTEEGEALTRKNMDKFVDGGKPWKCEICDFENIESSASCILCGTEKGFKLAGLVTSPSISSSALQKAFSSKRNDWKFQMSFRTSQKLQRSGTSLVREASFNRQRSFAIRRLNALNSRQRGARKRQAWVRKTGIDGKRFWSRREGATAIDSARPSLTSQPSLAFVAQMSQGKLSFKEYQEINANIASGGYEMSANDIQILEEVSALPFKEKYSWFLEQTSNLMRPWEDGHLKMQIHRENILVESMEQILGVKTEHIHMPMRIEFVGEPAIDAGGLEREWYTILTEKLFDETNGLFVCSHIESRAYMFNSCSSEASEDHLLYYRGTGRLIGRALLEGQFMKPHLALPLLKHLLGVPITFSDLEYVDQEVFSSLVYVRDHNYIEDLSLDFTITRSNLSGAVETIELKPNGSNIAVIDENKDEYLRLRLSYTLFDSFSSQLESFITGLFEVIPQELILVFDYQELELVLCGIQSIDVSDWREHTIYSPSMPNNLIEWFWDIVQHFTDEERARLLQFVTGSSRVPVQGFKSLTSYDGRICHFTLKDVEYPVNLYPKAHTCFNRIDLPRYKTREQLEEVLILVINMEVTGFTDE